MSLLENKLKQQIRPKPKKWSQHMFKSLYNTMYNTGLHYVTQYSLLKDLMDKIFKVTARTSSV